VAFIRSLGLAGVPITVYTDQLLAAGRYSRFVSDVRRSPDPLDSDEFVDWLVDSMRGRRFDLVAPTSDRVAFAIAEAADRLGEEVHWAPSSSSLRACLFKHEFSRVMARAGFPTPATCEPSTIAEAVDAAQLLGYPVMLKPRSHLGDADYRGRVVVDEAELIEELRSNPMGRRVPATVGAHDPHPSMTLVQQYLPVDRCDVISVIGCLAPDGVTLAVGVSRKLEQWPPEVGVGTLFESLPHQPYVDRAVDAVRGLLGKGLFELELLVERATGEAWPIDLNPRASGQITLEIARGNDLPLIWYRGVTGLDIPDQPRAVAKARTLWCQGLPYYTGEAVRIAVGPRRLNRLHRLYQRMRYPSVGAMMAWNDIGPSIAFMLFGLRHPGGLVKPFLRDGAERASPDVTR
jgi:biotin carboxylase